MLKHCDKHGETRHTGKVCHKCKNQRKIEIRRQQKIALIYLLGGSCCVCGYNKSIRALEFHHLNPLDKSFGISDNVIINYEKLKQEAKKCVLVCSNCHCEVEDGLVTINNFHIEKCHKQIEV